MTLSLTANQVLALRDAITMRVANISARFWQILQYSTHYVTDFFL